MYAGRKIAFQTKRKEKDSVACAVSSSGQTCDYSPTIVRQYRREPYFEPMSREHRRRIALSSHPDLPCGMEYPSKPGTAPALAG